MNYVSSAHAVPVLDRLSVDAMSDKETAAATQRHVWASHDHARGKRRLLIQICGQFWGGELVAELLTTRGTAGN